MNLNYCSELIETLLSWGVAEFYVCAGIRNTPIIEALTNIDSEQQIVFNHFEERSASFYALGRIKAIKKPVAVVVTSGTAVGELLPATMEAYYAGLPLILITADRPRNYRGTGAPQSAEHVNIFGNYVSASLDLEVNDSIDLKNAVYNRPLHINVCFDAPYNSGKARVIKFNCSNKEPIKSDRIFPIQKQITELSDFISAYKRAIVIVSKLSEYSPALINFLENQRLPIYFESISNIREHSNLENLKIKCADKLWEIDKKSSYQIDSVIKIGGTPTHRIWRDLDEKRKDIKVISISTDKFSGMPNALHIETNLEDFFNSYNNSAFKIQDNTINKLLDLDSFYYQKLQELINQYPNAEQSWYYHISNKLTKSTNIYIGNSLPIRYWDLTASYQEKDFLIEASRGLNGIDGQISTFLGFARDFEENFGIFGDLTAMYDLSALWMLQHRPNLNVNICIINNSGGQIFNNLLKGATANLVINQHQLNFLAWAEFWKLSYQVVRQIDELNINYVHNTVMEIIPSIEETNNFTSAWTNC
jgi:2-succinyl-5-enolpyruvyl-6-hydroxy-3-cyclohexene-1-carboxylate synthase